MSDDLPNVSLDEIRSLMSAMPGPDEAAAEAARTREAQLTKPEGALGELERIAEWFARWQGRTPPRLERPRAAVFVGNHGVAARGVSAFPQDVTEQMVRNFQSGGAAVNQLCKAFDADLRVYELALDFATGDICDGPAMTDEDCARAMAYGMMAVEEGVDLLCVGEMGIGNTTCAAALSCALFGGTARDWTGPGTGVSGNALERKIAAVEQAVDLHRRETDEPFELLRRLGGLELAAIAGAVLAARIGRVPVILDGFVATAAASVLFKAETTALDHCLAGHCSAEPGHVRLLDAIGKTPLLTLGMRLGEASGAMVALGLVKAAIACHSGMATFAEAGVSEKD